MQTISEINVLQQLCQREKNQGKTIGLVPTMGYLHDGHLALVKEALKSCDFVVVSIFVNPIQFGAGEDFEVYPRDLNRDTSLLEQEGVNILFTPPVREMYPPGHSAYVEVTGEMTEKLCGATRPGHFRGVTTVCAKLFNICGPDLAFFGQKDAQQVMVLEKMVKDMNFPLKIVRVPIVREADGLAMSSRNVYLEPEQRNQALVLNLALTAAAAEISRGERSAAVLKDKMRAMIGAQPKASIDYVQIYNAEDLSDVEWIQGQVLMALAVKFGKTRLIDNRLVEV